MTRAQLRTQVYNRLAEQAGFHTNDVINQWLRDGVLDASMELEPLVATATATTVAGTGEYNLPAGYISIKDAYYLDANDKWFQLGETTFQSLWTEQPNWEDESGLPDRYYWRADLIGLFPIPSAAYAGVGNLRLMYSYSPPDFGSDAGISGLPEWFDMALVSYAVWRARLKDRDESRAQMARAEYDIWLGKAGTQINKHRKEHAPQLVPDMSMYREYYQSGGRSYIGVASP